MRNIKTLNVGDGLTTPLNYSKKGMICSCSCYISDSKYNVLDKEVMVSYEVEPYKDRLITKYKFKKTTRRNPVYWGSFKQIVELPKIFDKLSDDDFIIKIGTFTRDNIQMPAISSLVIINYTKYQMIKTKEDRRRKLIKISNEDTNLHII